MGTASTGGRIITFYSYKGGTGRSMALANVAWILASNGYRVLAVDWDLEAPGLHRYFHPFLPDRELSSTPGLMDMLWSYSIAMMETSRGEDEQWREGCADVLDRAVSLRWAFPRGGFVDLLPAGQQDRSYATRVMSFDWENFYDRLHGGSFIEEMKRSMRRHYDYVLVDSRTGLNDTSGICTVQLPDTLVICFTLNNQSIAGSLAVADSIRRQRDASDLRILPVPMRVEDGESKRLEAARSYVRSGFRRLLSGSSAEERDRYWGDVEIPYKVFYAYEEILATVGDRAHQEGSLLAAYERLTSHLTEGRVRTVVPLDDADRESLTKSFWRQAVGLGLYDFFISHVRSDQRWAEWIAAHLEQLGYRVWVQSWDLRPGARLSEEIEKAILSSDVTLALLSPAAVRSVEVQQEWQLAREVDPGGEGARLVPVQVVECVPPPALRELNGIELAGSDEVTARRRLLSAVKQIQPPSGGHRYRREHRSPDGFPGRFPEVSNLPPRPRDMVGRDDEIFELWAGFQESGSAVQAVCGMGGVGKTALVLEYAYRFAHEYELVWWMRADREGGVPAGLTQLAVTLDLPAGHELTGPSAELLSVLRRRRSLLILDDAEELPDWIVSLSGGPDILVTSRLHGWDRDVIEHDLAPLSAGEAVGLLRKSAPALSEADAGAIATFVNGLPLALAVVRSTLSAGTSAGTIIQSLSSPEWGDLDEYVLASYWTRARDRLRGESAAAIELLRIVAFFAPDPVPYGLLTGTPATIDDPELRKALARESSFTDVLSALHRHSLIERTDESLRVHPLVQAAVRGDMTSTEAESCRRQGERLLVSARLGDPSDPANWPHYGQLSAHVLAVDWVNGAAMRALVLLLCGYLSASGQTESARALATTVVRRFTALLSVEHRDTASSMHVLATLIWEAGDQEEACELANRTWELRRRLLGAQHPETLATLNNIAVMLWSIGKQDEALAHNATVLHERRELLGADHPDTVVALGNRASMLYGLGRFDEALSYELTVYEKRTAALGERHPATLASLGNIASLRERMGRTVEAISTYERLAERSAEALGSEHPDTLQARFCLSRTMLRAGDVLIARQLLIDTLERQLRVLGTNHSQVKASRALLAEVAMLDGERS
ncbi:FxSxx-COOH system tetratricopeptide repeat protein [Micromonospora zamorensis]|uniref:FxSxx-COOH system tetratricopeptide repeat protein n=1 Tax=Micromonospora zamorensis TaxID=709883 RepID=UPI00352B7F28|nr:FxSxx-COOH system tetratricopeptide repeat protein [Micromonospora zamorensis]